MGQEFLFSVWNEHILIEHDSRMIWTESLMFLANKVTVPHISFDSIHNNTWDKLVGEIRLGFR
jgi:hypothetical protein